MNLINEFSERLQNNNKAIFIHVIGDSMLDLDYKVNSNRISPECPNVVILQSPHDKPHRQFPGGASNIVYQLNNFNVISRLFTFIDDEAYQIIRDKGVKYWGAVKLPGNSQVPRKRRMYAQGFQVVARWDIEQPNYGLECVKALQNQLLTTWQAFQAEPDAIIFSDYNKGLFKDLKISRFGTNAITIVDPKAAPLDRWQGCTVFKPNAKEAYELSGKKDWKEQCDYFESYLGCKAVVITQAGDGIVGKAGDYFAHKPKMKVTPVDIVGAGDCFAGTMALAMILNFNVEQAAQIADYGAGLCVQQKERGMFGPWLFSGKIVTVDNLIKLNKHNSLVFTNGCYDAGLTAGHIECFNFAKKHGDKLVVAINGDESVRRLKGPGRPIMPLKDRMKIVSSVGCVDYVISFDEDTPLSIIKEIKPKIIVKGSDYQKEQVAGYGIAEIVICPLYNGMSTTDKIKALNAI